VEKVNLRRSGRVDSRNGVPYNVVKIRDGDAWRSSAELLTIGVNNVQQLIKTILPFVINKAKSTGKAYINLIPINDLKERQVFIISIISVIIYLELGVMNLLDLAL